MGTVPDVQSTAGPGATTRGIWRAMKKKQLVAKLRSDVDRIRADNPLPIGSDPGYTRETRSAYDFAQGMMSGLNAAIDEIERAKD